MKKVLLGIVGLVVVVLAAAAVVFTKKPAQRAASTETITATPELVARGKYLAENVLQCLHCHTEMKVDRWSMAGDVDLGGGSTSLCWDESMGLPGKICPKNITPDRETGIGAWSDGEIARAIREGVSRDGSALFPVMPYLGYRELPDDDVKAVVAYLRTLPPVKRAVPPRELNFPLSVVVNFMPKPLEGPVARVDRTDAVAYGKHLATISGCKQCHTPVDEKTHQIIEAKAFSGGQEFKHAALGTVVSANLTPHETGLGGRTKEQFVAMFRAFADPSFRDVKIDPRTNTIMPWLAVAGMADEDLSAIYDFLRSVPSIPNAVARRTPPALPATAEAAAPGTGSAQPAPGAMPAAAQAPAAR